MLLIAINIYYDESIAYLDWALQSMSFHSEFHVDIKDYNHV